MDPELRARFNRAWSPGLYRRMRGDLERRLGCPIPFPLAETPIFLPRQLRERAVATARQVMEQLVQPAFIDKASATLPERYRGPGRGRLPQLAVVDLAIVRASDGSLDCRVVELQGFPSLYCFQIMLADVWATHLATLAGMPDSWRLFFSGMDRYRAMALLRETLLHDHDPEQVVLLDYRVEHQKTYPDFAATKRWFGIDPVCITELVRDQDRLYREKQGRRVAVRRIYHRFVFDELEHAQARLPFDPKEVMQVEWCPHPEWYFLWSKASLLFLDHPAIPQTRLLSEVECMPADPAAYVLKPLYSFAGSGVNIRPTAGDIAAIPARERSGWVLQEKVEYADALTTLEGEPVKAELRMMFARPDGQEQMTLLLNLGRLSRGTMMGVDHNGELAWTGASVGLWAGTDKA